MLQAVAVVGGIVCLLAFGTAGRWLLATTVAAACFAAAAVATLDGAGTAAAVFGLVLLLGLLSMSVRELLVRLGQPRRERRARRARRERMAQRRRSGRAAA